MLCLFLDMNLKELEHRLKTVFTYDKAMHAIFRYLKNNDSSILWMNKKQLFVDSIGSDEQDLGFYSMHENNVLSGKAGMPFTMVDSGLFKKGMRIDYYYRHITIQSIYHTHEMIQDGPFLTTEFFGLTEDNLQTLIRETIKPFMTKWMLSNL